MSNLELWRLLGESIVPAAIAFGATLYRSKSSGNTRTGTLRRLMSAVVIYVVCVVIVISLNLLIASAGGSNADAAVMIFAAIAGYVAGKRVLRSGASIKAP
jgi:hypothetical protein